jgi:predicted anti-sigma-YlaC factor YlaD
MSSSCGEVGLSVGAYLLGALSRPDRALVDAHLRACGECRADIESMHALPGLLARVREAEISDVADTSPELLDRVLSVVAQRRRRTSRIHVTASAVAGAMFAAAASVALHRASGRVGL